MDMDVIPSASCMCSFWGLQPHHITCDLHPSSVDAPVDVHSRSCNFLFFHLREALLVGHWVTTLPLSSCGILLFSPLTEVVLHGVGLVHLSCVWRLPIHKGTWWEEVSFGGGLMTFCVGLSLYKRGRQLWFDAPPPKSLLPTYPWSSSFPSRHPPSLVPGHQASSSLCLFFCHSTVSVWVLLPLIGLAPPIGQSSIYPVKKLHTCPHPWFDAKDLAQFLNYSTGEASTSIA